MACRAACRRISTQEEHVVALGYLFAAIFFIGGVGFVIVALTVADLLNALLLKRRPAKDKLTTYESGETPIGSAWVQYPLAFYIFALLFVAFDVDIVFILAWAVIFQQLSIFGFFEIVFFILTLALGLVYAWRKGVIRWI
jgi:NAD(P)H-quinone oxidoreductase subunit 3